jgi:hypothetical protein
VEVAWFYDLRITRHRRMSCAGNLTNISSMMTDSGKSSRSVTSLPSAMVDDQLKKDVCYFF